MRNIITLGGGVLLALAIVAVGVTFLWKKTCDNFLAKTYVTGEYIIEKGSSYPAVYRLLFSNQDVPMGFNRYLVKIRKIDRSLHYGYYEADNISLEHLLQNILTGHQTLIKVTFPKGYNMYDVASTLANADIAGREAMLGIFTDREVVRQLTGHPYESLEGYLAPGTYFFSRNYPPVKIAEKMVAEFYRSLPADFEAKALKQGLSFYDAVILASIVQKETYSAEEAPVVAAVFLNRLKVKMLIQADPTIIYGKYTEYDGRIRSADLRDATNRYNTYRHKGLPPTPISNPSRMALEAVIEPAKTDYYYFVARQDGTHVFARSYEEHRRNVNIHQLGRSN